MKRVVKHYHVVEGLYLHRDRTVKTSIEHEHECDVDVPHFHSGSRPDGEPDPNTQGARTGRSMSEAPEPAEMQPGLVQRRLWRPLH